MRAFLAVFFLGSLLALASCNADESDPGGDPQDTRGTTKNPWEVDSLAELQSIATGFQNEELDEPLSLEESLAAHYIQTADIDASDTASGNWMQNLDDNDTPDDTSDDVTQHGFLPIGNCGADNYCFDSASTSEIDESADNKPFTGSFDGDGYTISGLHIDRSTTDSVGLFGFTDGAVLRNIALDGGSVTGDWRVGGLIGWNQSSIDSSYATGSVTGDVYVGGLIGYNDGTIDSSYATGDVSGSRDVGGLIGFNDGTIDSSYATGSVTGSVTGDGNSVGGLIGWNQSSIDSSYATGDVSGSRDVGGLIGFNDGTIDSSYATGSVTGRDDFVGGLIGFNQSSIDSSYATGSVTGDDYVGGLVGLNYYSGTIDSSYATGSVTGRDDFVGGLIGFNRLGGTVQDSFATGDVSGVDEVGGLVGFNGSTVQRSYCVDGTISDEDGNDDGVADCVGDGTGDALSLVTLDALKALTCATAVFDACDAWDFGTSEELPVLSGTVGGLDPAGQRALITPTE